MSVNKIIVSVNEFSYTDWEEVEVDIDMEEFGRIFSLKANIPNSEVVSLVKGHSIIIDIDGETVLTGYIDKISSKEDASSSEVVITGRDKISDFIDSRVSGKTFSTPVGFQDVLERLLEFVGYEVVSPKGFGLSLPSINSSNKISIINNFGIIEDFQTNEGITFPASEEAFQLVRRLADKRGLVLGTDGDGNITIDKIAPETTTTILERTIGGKSNNVKTASLEDSMANRFNEYRIISSGTGGGSSPLFSGEADPINDDLTQYSAVVYDSEIRPTRKFLGKVAALTNSQCKDRASWELNIRKAKDFRYTCEVVGFRQNLVNIIAGGSGPNLNPLWTVNKLAYLNDERYKLADDYLIKSVRYKQSIQRGSTTRITLIDKNSYTYSLFEPKFKKDKKKDKDLLFTKKEV